MESSRRTLGYFSTGLGFVVVYCSSTLLKKLIALYADVDHFRPFYGKLNELFHYVVDDLCRGL